MRTPGEERTVRAALLLGEVMERISLGIPPRRSGDLPHDLDPTGYPSLRFLSGIELDDTGPAAVLRYDLPDGTPTLVRLAAPASVSRDRRHLVDLAHAFLERMHAFETAMAAGEDGIRTLHLAGRRFDFTPATIDIARKAVLSDMGRIPDAAEIGRFFDGFLARCDGDVQGAVTGSPRATCYAALAVETGIGVWPCGSGFTPYLQ